MSIITPNVFALVMMVKNEENHHIKSFESVKDFVNTIVLYDTGSTDRTIEQAKEWCAKYDKKLYVKKGTFVNFAISRNESIKFANISAKEPYFILLDALVSVSVVLSVNFLKTGFTASTATSPTCAN
jgi:glycosyltransferase involved in cell wall biosynthesis